MKTKKISLRTQKRREQAKEDLKAKILAAAQQIITQEGFAALSMRRLAEQIHYSAASLYLHFRSREQIAQELSEVGFRELFTMLSAAAGQKDLRERIEAVALAYVSFGLQHPETYRLIFQEDSAYMAAAFAKSAPDSAANQSYELLVNLANDLRQEGLYKGEASARKIAEMIWAALHGIISLRLACAGFQSSAEEMAQMMVDTLVSGLLQQGCALPSGG
jgi:AcrR family transcriptional regulator